MAQQITLNESQLREMVYNTVMESLQENPELMEGFFGDAWGAIKDVGTTIGQRAAQTGNYIYAKGATGVANNRIKAVSAEIKKCQDAIAQMNARIQQLRASANKAMDASDNAIDRANNYAAKRGSSDFYAKSQFKLPKGTKNNRFNTKTNRFSNK